MIDDLKLIPIYIDGRVSLAELYEKYLELEENFGWRKEIVYSIEIETAGGKVEVPIYCFLSPKSGKSLWLLTGIHGEEPVGPNAVYRQIERIGALGRTVPMVVMPLLNPAGYYRNWRFHNMERSLERLNVTDCRHLIADPKNPNRPILEKPVHEVADKTTKYILNLLRTYPPSVFFDLHEDELLSEGYVYSQGVLEGRDPVALRTVKLLVEAGVALKMSGATRFASEKITNGLVTDEVGGRVHDGSIDEWMANATFWENGAEKQKPFTTTSIVSETPGAGSLTLEHRIGAQESILIHLEELWRMVI